MAFTCPPRAGEMEMGGSPDSLAKQLTLLGELQTDPSQSRWVALLKTTHIYTCLPVYPHTRTHTYTRKLSLKFITLRFYLIQQGYALLVSLTVVSLKRASMLDSSWKCDQAPFSPSLPSSYCLCSPFLSVEINLGEIPAVFPLSACTCLQTLDSLLFSELPLLWVEHQMSESPRISLFGSPTLILCYFFFGPLIDLYGFQAEVKF